MAVEAEERRFLLNQLSLLTISDLRAVWQAASDLDSGSFSALITEAFPEVVAPYVAAASEMSAAWFESSAPELDYTALTTSLPEERLEESVRWALGGEGEKGLARLEGSAQRAVFDGARETTMLNAELEPGTRWAREARADACAFCRMMSTRGAVYRTERDALRVSGRSADLTLSDRRMRAGGLATTDELLRRRMGQTTYVRGKRKGQKKTRAQRGKQALGDKYHDHCYCIAVEVRTGYYEPPEYAMEWENEYLKARSNAGTGDPRKVLAAWRELGVK